MGQGQDIESEEVLHVSVVDGLGVWPVGSQRLQGSGSCTSSVLHSWKEGLLLGQCVNS